MTGNKPLKALTLSALLLMAFVTAVPMTATAQEETTNEGVVGTLFHHEQDRPASFALSTIRAYWGSKVAKYNPLADQPEESDAKTYANNVRDTFNANSDSIMKWTNERVEADSDYDVTRLKLKDKSGNKAWLFIVSTANETSGDFENAQAMNLSEFKDADREYDRTYRMSAYASRNANEELKTFVENYAKPNEDLDEEYVSSLVGTYATEVEGEGLPGDVDD